MNRHTFPHFIQTISLGTRFEFLVTILKLSIYKNKKGNHYWYVIKTKTMDFFCENVSVYEIY